MRRLVVTGSECSGKTTLASTLAIATGAPVLLEAARSYAERRRREGFGLTRDDVEPIARLSIADEDDLIADRSPAFVVRDTDLISTVVYARHYYGACPAWIEIEATRRAGDMYLLCSPDLPWIADGIRDAPRDRARMHTLFAAVLEEFAVPVANVSAVKPETVQRAIDLAFDLQAGA